MPKLSPESQAKRTAKFKATMQAKKQEQIRFAQAKAEHQAYMQDRGSSVGEVQSAAEQAAQDEQEGWVQVTPAALLAMAPVKQAKALPKNDPRVELARDIVRLLTKVLQ